jgi:hypothetical protein
MLHLVYAKSFTPTVDGTIVGLESVDVGGTDELYVDMLIALKDWDIAEKAMVLGSFSLWRPLNM